MININTMIPMTSAMPTSALGMPTAFEMNSAFENTAFHGTAVSAAATLTGFGVRVRTASKAWAIDGPVQGTPAWRPPIS